MGKNYMSIDFSAFADYAERLDNMQGDLTQIIGDAMEQAAATVQDDTRAAVSAGNLPAGGKYSDGPTESSIATPEVQVSGSLLEVGVGFDKSVPGSGGWLITGTPKMAPDGALQKIFMTKRYAKGINDKIRESLRDALDSLGGG